MTASHARMAADRLIEEHEMEDVLERAVADVPEPYRSTYLMARDTDDSYMGKQWALAYVRPKRLRAAVR